MSLPDHFFAPIVLDPSVPVQLQDLVVTVTRFKKLFDTEARPWEGQASKLVNGRHAVLTQKKAAAAFSPVVYPPGAKRSKESVLAVTALVLDFDHVSAEVAEAVRQQLRGRASVLYTTWSHGEKGEDDCCFRVVLFLSRPMRPDEFERVWPAVHKHFGAAGDPSTDQVSRVYLLPSCPKERQGLARVEKQDGRLLDVDRALARAGAPEPVPAPPCEEAPSGPIAQGGRNAHLTSLAGALRRRGAEHDTVLAALVAENRARCSPPLPDDEVRAIARSICHYEPDSPLLTKNNTDLGNAERFAEYAQDKLRYVHAWGAWMAWDGRRWRHDQSGQVFRLARDLVRTLAAMAERGEAGAGGKALLDHALQTERAARFNAMVALSTHMLHLGVDQLDQEPWLLNVKNGTLDLRSGLLRPHRREDWLTKLSPVAFDPAATCPRWEAFLARIMDGNDNLIRFLQRAVGYTLTGMTGEQALFFLYGVGANGKSTFLEVVRAMMGDHATAADFSTFQRKDTDGARNDLARLAGARMVSAVEAERGKPMAESVLKQITGGDPIAARFLFKEYFEYNPVFKLWIAANHRQHISGTDHGIWRRIKLIPFTVTIPEQERDPGLKQKLMAELPGILGWALRGCLDWQKEGLGIPAEVREATEDYRDSMDPLGGFLAELCALEPGATATAKELYAAYLKWAEANAEQPIAQRTFGARLLERGLQNAKGARGVRMWKGLRLREPVTLVERPAPPSAGGGDRWEEG